MQTSRFFAPHFVTYCGSHFLAVDHTQPVLATISHSGAIVDVASWSDRVDIPAESPWPNRRFAMDGDRFLVQDLPAEPLIEASVDATGTITTSVESPDEFPSRTARYRRMWTAHATYESNEDSHWQFHSHLNGIAWSSDVTYDGSQSVRFESPASIVSHCTTGLIAAVCVQRENKRPFPLRPCSDLHILTAHDTTLTDMPVEQLDITSHCWRPQLELSQQQRELRNYMAFPLGDLHVDGLRNAQVVVRGTGLSTVIETRFCLDSDPNTVFCRQDQPFDELGHLRGLRDMTVLLDEDINGSALASLFMQDAALVYI